MRLTSDQESVIESVLNNLFETIKAKYLGQWYKGPKIFFSTAREANPMNTVGGIFEYTLRSIHPNPSVDYDMIQKLANTSGNYIEAEKKRALDRIHENIGKAKDGDDFKKIVEDSLEPSNNYMNMLMTTEVRNAQSRAEVSGIQQIGAALGMNDPTIVKLGVVDPKLCPACRKLWHTEEDIRVPRAYKLSELSDGYNTDMKNPLPTTLSTHPHCRHTMSIIPLGYGYVGGSFQFISPTYNLLDDQRGLGKSELIFSLDRSSITQNTELFLFAYEDDPCDQHAHIEFFEPK
jgi:hypothetical protein